MCKFSAFCANDINFFPIATSHKVKITRQRLENAMLYQFVINWEIKQWELSCGRSLGNEQLSNLESLILLLQFLGTFFFPFWLFFNNHLCQNDKLGGHLYKLSEHVFEEKIHRWLSRRLENDLFIRSPSLMYCLQFYFFFCNFISLFVISYHQILIIIKHHYSPLKICT